MYGQNDIKEIMYTNDIRSAFLRFFQSKGHQIVSSSPLVPHNDPSLMFTNSGMVQFKNVFTGLETRPYTQAVTAQKCVRAGGKHNDLENVGHTARHHTFFEMLGNFSFGDYFKEQAITYAWNFLTKELEISPEKLYVTVYAEDAESYALWKKLTGFPDHKIIKIGTSDNFWSMGETGPCGPCTEIFYDHGEHVAGGLPGTPEQDGDRFVEIWNLVFMQYERLASGEQILLPQQSVDTGMGLERISAVMQGVQNNYDTDILKSLVVGVAQQTQTIMEGAALVSQRVIADHLRAACFLLADGVTPSNEGREYVLRRIMRRAMRHAYLLGAKDPVLCQLVPLLQDKMGSAYPELARAEDLIKLTLRLEEERFSETFQRGMRVLQDGLQDTKNKRFSGLAAFKLYDTYGFPLDLTEDILREHHVHVDKDEFDQAMQHQRQLARAAWTGSGDTQDEAVWFDLKEKHGSTEFMGYSHTSIEGTVLALVKEGKITDALSAGEDGYLVVNQTPFYGESGGQVGDTGHLVATSVKADITNTQKKADGLIVHHVNVASGALTVGQAVSLKIDQDRRSQLKANHSATHLLHEILRRRFGNSVVQKGSLVAPDKLRFDFNYHQKLTEDDLCAIELAMNKTIRSNALVTTDLSSPEEAIKKGAQALFGEKYGEEVRVVTMGHDTDPVSVELCGGTHVTRLGEIGHFKILSESSAAAGVRRIEAVTGQIADAYVQDLASLVDQIASILKVPAHKAGEKIASLMQDKKDLEKQLKSGTSTKESEGMETRFQKKGLDILVYETQSIPPKDLRPLMDHLKQKLKSGVIILSASYEDKHAVLVGVTSDTTDREDAREILSNLCAAEGLPKGGGRPDLAQTGGQITNVKAAVQRLFGL